MSWPKVTFLFEPCDAWIGAFWSRAKKRLYLLPLPCLGIVLDWAEEKPAYVAQIKPTLVLAYNTEAGRAFIRLNSTNRGSHRYISTPEDLMGYHGCPLIKLDGWTHGKSEDFVTLVAEYERFRR